MNKTAKQWIEEWTKMNEELEEEGCALFLKIPSVEQTKKWMEQSGN